MRIEARRLFRYLLTGAVAWLADVVVFAASLGALGIAMAQLLARITGAVLAFFGHKLFVFGEADLQRTTLTRQGVRYALLWIWSYSVSTLALIGLIDHGRMDPIVAKVMVEVAVVTMNYFVMKGLIFHSRASGGTRA